MPLSISGADRVLKDITGRTDAYSRVYVGFLTADPIIGNDGSQTYVEPLPINVEDNGYTRVLIGEEDGTVKMLDNPEFDSVTPSNPTKRITRNHSKSIISVECVNEDWTPILCFALFRSERQSSGDLICWGRLQDAQGQPITQPIAVEQGKIPIFRKDCLELSFKIVEETT